MLVQVVIVGISLWSLPVGARWGLWVGLRCRRLGSALSFALLPWMVPCLLAFLCACFWGVGVILPAWAVSSVYANVLANRTAEWDLQHRFQWLVQDRETEGPRIG